MTLKLAMPDAAPLSPEACVDALHAMRFDPRDEAAFVAAAPLLAGLAADRRFLGDLLIEELGARGRMQEERNDYGAQVVLLHRASSWFLRANIWPAAADPMVRRNGARRFFYGVPHDHNFSFLTIGYHGPGYWSDYYEYVHEAIAGVPGEAAGLRFVERAALPEGRMLLYRAHRDIHSQHPPEAMSVSLNLAQGGNGRAFANQYRFDLARGTIADQLAHTATEALLALMPELGGDAGRGLLARFARSHPSDRVRFGAIAAQAGAAGSLAERAELLARATADRSAQIAGLARHRLAELEAGRAWLDGAGVDRSGPE